MKFFIRSLLVSLIFVSIITLASPVTMADSPYLSEIKLSEDHYSMQDYVEIDFDVSGFKEAYISVEIANSTQIVREYVYLSHKDGHIKLRWNGRDSQGNRVDDGVYTVTVKVSQNSLKYLHSFDKYMWPADRPKGVYDGNFSFGNPSDVAIDSKGFLFVSDHNTFVYRPDGTSYNMIRISCSGIGMGPDDNAFLPFTFEKVDAAGNVKAYEAKGKTRWTSFEDAAINSSGYVFITGLDNTEGSEMGPFLRLYDSNLSFIRTLASKDLGPSNSKGYSGIAVNSSDYVFVAEQVNKRVSIFNPAGEYYGEVITEPLQPMYVTVDRLDNLYVTMCYDMPKIEVYSPDGYNIADSGDLSEYGIKHPMGIAVSPDGHIYVCNIDKHNINVFYMGILSQTCQIIIDHTPVEVSSVNPSPGSTAIDPGVPVTVTFSEAVDPATVTDETFLLNGGSVNWTLVYDQQTATARFEPVNALLPNTTYQATLTNGVKDLSGNPLSANFSWNFTTGETVKPVITSTPTCTPVVTPTPAPAGNAGIILAWSGVLLAGLLFSGRK